MQTSAASHHSEPIGVTVPSMSSAPSSISDPTDTQVMDNDIFTNDRIESSHAGTCSSCDAYPVPTKGGLCPSCRLPVETVSDPCGCSGSERSAS